MANLTSKELTAIEDQLAQEDILIKKYRDMAASCNDSNIKSSMENIANKHQNHYNRLAGYLQ
jgi:rubrerythrin